MATKIPTLTDNGWIEEVDQKADRVMAWFILSQHSQSILWAGKITSLPYLLHEHRNDPTNLREAVEEALRTLMNRYFDHSDNIVNIVDDPNGSGKYGVRINTKIWDNGIEYSLDKEILLANDGSLHVMDLNNDGDFNPRLPV